MRIAFRFFSALMVALSSFTAEAVLLGNGVRLGSPESSAVSVKIIRLGVDDLICSGVLIAPKLVLTAAHCLEVSKIYEAKVRFVNGDEIPVANVKSLSNRRAEHRVPHPPVDSYDIAILKLSEPASSEIPVARVDEIGIAPRANEELIVAGGGYNRVDDTGADGIVRSGKQLWYTHNGKSEALLLPGPRGQALCVSDSGGPVFITRRNQLVLWGIYKAGNADCTLSAVTRVMPYSVWIRHTIQRDGN